MSVAWQGVYPAVTTQFHADQAGWIFRQRWPILTV